jgi:hypothetical protein
MNPTKNIGRGTLRMATFGELWDTFINPYSYINDKLSCNISMADGDQAT